MEFTSNLSPADLQGQLTRRAKAEWLALAAMGLLGLLLSVFGVLTERRLILREESERLQVQARIVDENLRRQLHSVRNALDSLRHAVQERGSSNAAFFQALKSAMPGVRAIVALDGQGRIVQSSDDLRDAHLDDRDFLQGVAGMRDPQTLYLARPYENTPGEWNIKLSMATSPGAGNGHGVVTAILNTTSLDVVTQSVVYAPDMASAIAQEGGFVVASVPPHPHEYSGQHAMADPDKLQALRTIPAADLTLEKPLLVTVSRSRDAMDRSWMRLALECGVAWCVFALVSGVGLFITQRRRAAFVTLAAKREAERNEHAQRIELTLAGANLGLWELQLAQGRLRIDRRVAAFLDGQRSGDALMEWSTWRDQVHPDDLPAVEHALALHLAGDRLTFESEHRLRNGRGDWVWVLSRGRTVERDGAGQPVRLLGTCMDISDRKRHEEEIERLAFYDGLTGLPNRRLLMDRLGRAVVTNARLDQCGAVLFIDLDNFKDLNDTLGHDTGDRLLAEVAARLLTVTRKSDTVARLGGDEFVVLLEGLSTSLAQAAERAEHVGRCIVESLSRPYRLGSHMVHSSPSIGIALFGDGSPPVDELLKHADLAMYQAKSAGRNTLRLFDPQMQTMVAAGAELESDLRGAQDRGELTLHYQFVVDADRCAIGAEALLRWTHPARGAVSPAEFIPVAEKAGLILPIGAWVLDRACAQLREWSMAEATRHLTISVNVSARQLRQDDFVDQVISSLRRHSVAPTQLKLELTESMLLNDVQDVIRKMNALQSMGVGFSLDDFGTGYSSLGYLRQLPLDQLKIDQSFVREVLTNSSDASIAKAIIGMAHSLGLSVVAEGVENEDQRRFLLDSGCNHFQGYMFSRPGPAEWVARMLSAHAPGSECASFAH